MSENTHITNRPLVFIHGAWHGAWCWDPWIEIFKNQGYSATAIELRGHGYKKGEYKHARLEDYIVDVETVLNVFDEPPILIGHSLGCSIIQHVISTQGYPAAVLVAPIPAPHVFRSILLEQMLRHPILALKSLVTMDMKPWAGSRVSKKMFFSTAANDLQSKTYLDLMQGESFELFILDCKKI
jgi:pimeloyl-ACP methyl ester carboxylesterase